MSDAPFTGDSVEAVFRFVRKTANQAANQANKALDQGKNLTGEVLQGIAGGTQRLADAMTEKAAAQTRRACEIWRRQSADPDEAAAIETGKKQQLLAMIDELEKNPNDHVRLLGDIGITAGGAVAGAAGVVAAGVGVTSYSLFGLATITLGATPLGWIIGAGMAGAAAAYGVSRLIHDGGKCEARMEDLRRNYAKQVKEMEARERRAEVTEEDRRTCMISMRALIERGCLSADTARRFFAALESGKMPLSRAYQHLEALAKEGEEQEDETISTITPTVTHNLQS